MNAHKHARMTPLGRALLVRRIDEEGWPVAAAAQAAGISQRTAFKWLARFRAGGAGWDHVHVAVDDASRLAYTEILSSEGQQDATAFLARALVFFARHGVTVERVMTDNGNGYRSRLFAQLVASHGLRHIRTRPHTPRTNGKAERFIQTSLREWAYARTYQTSRHRAQAMASWIDAYNLFRPHTALAGLSPWQRLNNLLGNDSRHRR
jgi:transposase InsO family protein